MTNKLQIKVKYLDDSITKLEKVTIGDWIDLRAAEDIVMKQFDFKLVHLGIAMQLPEGYEANIVPRSSTYKNFGILQTNSFAVIDESYCGDNDWWRYPIVALKDTEIKKGDRICQFRINKKMSELEIMEVEILGNKDRNGLGSTGIK